MGTRALTLVYNKPSGEPDNKPFVNLYRQFDGYPDGHGLELAEFLVPITVVNGFGKGEVAGTHANGMGCLAAQLVSHFKTVIGGFYLQDPNNTDCWQDYDYHVWPDKVEIVEHYNNKTIFSGTWTEFKTFCENPVYPDDE